MSTAPHDVKHVPAGTGRALGLMGSALTLVSDPDDNGDAAMLFEHLMPPGLGVPPHHEHNYEAFHVLEGVLQVEAGGRGYELRAGDFLGIPPGVVHALHNPGPGPMRVLTLVAPGRQHKRFFSALGTPIDDPQNPPPPDAALDPARVMQVGRECGIEFAPPES